MATSLGIDGSGQTMAEQRRLYDASALKEDVVDAATFVPDYSVGPPQTSAAFNVVDLPGGTAGSLRNVILHLQNRIASGALKGVQVEWFELNKRRCSALCRGQIERSVGVTDSEFTLTGPEGDVVSLRVLMSFPVRSMANSSGAEMAVMMPHFGLIRRGSNSGLPNSRVAAIAQELESRRVGNRSKPVEVMIESCLRFVANELTRLMDYKLKSLTMDPRRHGNGNKQSKPSVDLFSLEMATAVDLGRDEDSTDFYKSSEAARQPCPRYCGAKFSGAGLLVHFDNFNDFVHVQIWKAPSLSPQNPRDCFAGKFKDTMSFPRTYADLKNRIEYAKASVGLPSTINGAKGGPPKDAYTGKPKAFNSGGRNRSESQDTSEDPVQESQAATIDELQEGDLYDSYFDEEPTSLSKGDSHQHIEIEDDTALHQTFSHASGSPETLVFTPKITLLGVTALAAKRFLARFYRFGVVSRRKKQVDEPQLRFRAVTTDALVQPVEVVRTCEGVEVSETLYVTDVELANLKYKHELRQRKEIKRHHCWYDFDEEMYGFTRRTIEASVADPFLQNEESARSVRRVDLEEMWRVLALVSDEKIAAGEAELSSASREPWSYHPCGSMLIQKLFAYYTRNRDVQTIATIACVLQDQAKSTIWQGTERLINEDLQKVADGYQQGYAQILHHWGLYITRAEVLKYTTSQGSTDQERSFIWKHPVTCVVCNVRTRGMVTFCKKCGHGGHSQHMTEWFQEFTVCPTGCGCHCGEELLQ